jgi:shikimate dehydrogenase
MSPTIDPKIRTGLVGVGVDRSRAPERLEAEAAAHGLELSCVRFDLAEPPFRDHALSEVLDRAECRGFAGVTISHAFRRAAVALVDVLSPEAERLGVVDTIVFGPHCRFGHNADSLAFAKVLRRGLSSAPRNRVVQLGAGVAGLAMAYALLRSGVERLTLVEPDDARGRELAGPLERLFGPGRVELASDLEGALATAAGLVNAAPAGTARNVPAALLRSDLWVADVVDAPQGTELLRDARRAGCRTLDGGEIALFQAAETFRLFVGPAPEPARMKAGSSARADVEA